MEHYDEEPLGEALPVRASKFGHVGVDGELLPGDEQVRVHDVRHDERAPVEPARGLEQALVEQEGLDARRLGPVVGVGGPEVVRARGEDARVLGAAEAPARAHEVRRRVVALRKLRREGLRRGHVLGVGRVALEALAEAEHRVGALGAEERIEHPVARRRHGEAPRASAGQRTGRVSGAPPPPSSRSRRSQAGPSSGSS